MTRRMAVRTWTIRLSEELFARLREEHAQSYPQHRLSFNRWLLRLIESGLTTNQTEDEVEETPPYS